MPDKPLTITIIVPDLIEDDTGIWCNPKCSCYPDCEYAEGAQRSIEEFEVIKKIYWDCKPGPGCPQYPGGD